MAIRVRCDGTMWSAALTKEQEGDTYIDDSLHYQMAIEHGVICTYPEPRHSDRGGQWFWSNQAPDGCDDTFVRIPWTKLFKAFIVWVWRA